MNIQLDTNIVIDLLEEREPYVETSARFFNEAIKQNHAVFITANSVDNIAYILRRKVSRERLAQGLESFFKIVDIIPVTKPIILKAVSARWKDLEDAIQYFSALEAQADLIITRDIAGYEEQKVKIATPEDSLKLLKQE